MGLQRSKILGSAACAAALIGSLAVASAPAWASAPGAITNAASEVKRARATLNGYVVPNELETTYYFEYGTEACNTVAVTCGVKTPTRGPILEQAAAEPLKVTRLKPGTTYHFWVVASNSEGTTYGTEETFTTATAEPNEYVFDKNLEGHVFAEPLGVGVNQATGDVYVSDFIATGVEQFDAAGTWQSGVEVAPSGNRLWQVAVDNSGGPTQGDVYVTDATDNFVYKYDRAATKDPADEGSLIPDEATPTIGAGVVSEPSGVVVNSSGDVYVASNTSVSEFSPTGGVQAKELITGLSGGPKELAVDAAGDLYVASASGTVEYTSAGVCVNPLCEPIDAQGDTGVALDSLGDIFTSDPEANTVTEYGFAAGHLPIANPELTGKIHSYGLAVNDTSQALYATDENTETVKVFGYKQVTPVIVTTETATQVKGAGEALNGMIDPNGLEPAEYYFEYGIGPCNTVAETCGTVATEASQVPLYGDEAIPVSVRLNSLAPNTTYHYWVVGVNEESGVEHGAEQTFTTGSEPSSPSASFSEGSAPESKTPASSPVYPLLTGIAPVPEPKAPPAPKPLTRAQRLTKALAACNRKPKKQRASCKRQARRKYGPVTKGVAKQRKR